MINLFLDTRAFPFKIILFTFHNLNNFLLLLFSDYFNIFFDILGISNSAQAKIKVMAINFGNHKMATLKMQILVVQCLNL